MKRASHLPIRPRCSSPHHWAVRAAVLFALGASSCQRLDADATSGHEPEVATAGIAPLGGAEAFVHPVRVRGPDGAPTVVVGRDPDTGEEIRANCTTCHATRAPRPEASSGSSLVDFHTGLVTNHGGLSCLTCHDAARYDRLRLADGRSLEHTESMRLCGQCHGPQLRDWKHGSHGGMAGHWDLTRGERVRNHCVVCHDPHAPQIGPVLPLPPPNDRFLGGSHSDTHTNATTEDHAGDDHE